MSLTEGVSAVSACPCCSCVTAFPAGQAQGTFTTLGETDRDGGLGVETKYGFLCSEMQLAQGHGPHVELPSLSSLCCVSTCILLLKERWARLTSELNLCLRLMIASGTFCVLQLLTCVGFVVFHPALQVSPHPFIQNGALGQGHSHFHLPLSLPWVQ